MGRLKADKIRAKNKGTKTKKSTGGYGSKRDTPARSAKQVTRRNNRLQDSRVRTALEEARAAEERIERMAQAERLGAAPGAMFSQPKVEVRVKTSVWKGNWLFSGYACPGCKSSYKDCHEKQMQLNRPCCVNCDGHDEYRERERHLFEPYEGDPKLGHTIGGARRLVEQGYHAAAVMRRTGVGFKWIEDLVGIDGYLKASKA